MLSIKNKKSIDKKKHIKIAKIEGGKDNKKFIVLDTTYDMFNEKNICEALKKINCSCPIKNNECPKIKEALMTQIEPVEQENKEKYYQALKELNKLSGNEINIKNGKVTPLPRKDIVEKIYVSAPSGSGKSTWCGKYIKEFLKMFKDDELFVFSTIEKDDVLDKHNPIRIKLDENIISQPIMPDEVEYSLCVFDDVDTIIDPSIRASIVGLRDWLLEQGRHFNCRMLNTTHILMNYKKTARLLNEATSVVLFPKCSSAYHLKRYLKVYAGFDNNQIRKFMNLNSRWVQFMRTYPRYIIHEKGAYMLNNEE